jgi:predicted CxxxxCH...CXXCH cytochrome family protein
MSSWIKKITLLCLTLGLFACSNANSGSPTALVDNSGNHPSDWVFNHWKIVGNLAGKNAADAAAAGAAAQLACLQCHGADLLGGISKVSCFQAQDQSGQQCHATNLGHPSGWERAIQHGQGGAMASAGKASGFAYCARCHGTDYRGNGPAVSCFSCHATAPHPPKPWLVGNLSHATTSPSDAAACFQCHAGGQNFGAVLVSAPLVGSPAAPTPDCFNNTLCHGGAVQPPHSIGVTFLQGAAHGASALTLGLTTCKTCHADANARFNRTGNNMVNGCETCHAAFTAHPTPWLPGRSVANAKPSNPNLTSHALVPAASLATECALCHGAALDGVGNRGGAPSCLTASPQFGISCHATSPVAHPTDCNSCHSGFVGNHPTTGAHAVHLGLPGVSCDACHSGGGADPVTRIGGPLHANGFLNISSAAYWAKTGGFRYDTGAKTCANVRCHGGQTTPSWTTGTLNVTTGCLICHQQGNAGNTPQTPQFNSFYSGLFSQAFPPVNLHQFHLGLSLACTDCHSLAKLTTAVHFAGLSLATFPSTPGVLPGDTVAIPGTYVKDPATQTYPGTCNNVACHNIAPKNASWGK